MEPQAELDSQGNQTGILSLEPKSVKPYATKDEYLYAMKEDLAEWFNTLYGLDIGVDNFFEQLETGVAMCQHANNVQSFIAERQAQDSLSGGKGPSRSRRPSFSLPDKPVQYRTKVTAGSFQCRDNVSNFIAWCRAIGINEVVLFETEDLVMRKNERSVVLGLLEVARRGAQYGMLAPTLVQLEVEIDAEIAGHEITAHQPPPARPRKTCDLRSLDERVREMVSLCTCPDQFPMYKVSDGKYKIGDSQTLIFVRILRNHVMVRIGGGWDTLENYLDRHDPCRCAARGHRGRTAGMTSQTPIRRQGAPSQHLLGVDARTRTVTPSTDTEQHTPSKNLAQAQRSKRSPSHSVSPAPQGESARRAPYSRPPAANLVSRSLDFNPASAGVQPITEATARNPAVISTSHDGSRREVGDSASETGSSCGGSPGLHKRCNSATDLTFPKEMTLSNGSSKLPRQRPTSSRDRMRRSTVTCGVPNPTADATGRGRQKQKSDSDIIPGRHNRSRSVEPSDLTMDRFSRSTGVLKPTKRDTTDMLVVSRDDSGKHRLGPSIKQNGNNNNCKSAGSRHSSTSSTGNSQTNGYSSNGDEAKRPGTNRINISPDRILPDRPKIMSRSHTADLAHIGENNGDDELARPLSRTCMSVSSNQSSTLSIASSYEDYLEPPPKDELLNAEMERQFEEYFKTEHQTRSNKKSRHSRHMRSNSADFLEMDAGPFDRQRLQRAFQNGQGSSRDSASTGGYRAHSRRSSAASSASSSARQSTSSTPRRTITPTPTRTSSLRGALGMARELRNKINDNVNNRNVPNRSSSLNSPNNRYQNKENFLDSSKKGALSTMSGSRTRSRSRDNVLDDIRSQQSRGRSQSRDGTFDTGSKSRSGGGHSRTQSRDNSLTRARPGSALGLTSNSSLTTNTSHRPSSARPPHRRSQEDLLDNPSAPRYQRQRSHSTTAIFPDSDSPDGYSLSPDRDCCQTSHLIELELDTGGAYKAKPRRDDRGGRTRIPMPVDMMHQQKMSDFDNFPPLRRFDSGVDINNLSPTESSIQGEEAWQQELLLQSQPEATAMSNQPLTYPQTDANTSKGDISYQDIF